MYLPFINYGRYTKRGKDSRGKGKRRSKRREERRITKYENNTSGRKGEERRPKVTKVVVKGTESYTSKLSLKSVPKTSGNVIGHPHFTPPIPVCRNNPIRT